MKRTKVRTRSLAEHAVRVAVFTSVSLAMFLLAACQSSTPSGQPSSSTLTGPQSQNSLLMKASSLSASSVPLGSV